MIGSSYATDNITVLTEKELCKDYSPYSSLTSTRLLVIVGLKLGRAHRFRACTEPKALDS